jgi:hypothetical protein
VTPQADAQFAALAQCTIANGYRGLDEFRSFAASSPAEVWPIVFALLASRSDPGKYDGALSLELLNVAADTTSSPQMECDLEQVWPILDEESRVNLLEGFGTHDVFSLALARRLFESPATSVRVRHWLVANLASARRTSPEVLKQLARRIGHYEDPARQETLEAFRADVERL